METVILILLIIFYIEFKIYKNKLSKFLNELSDRFEKIEFPKEYREMKKLWGYSDNEINTELKKINSHKNNHQ